MGNVWYDWGRGGSSLLGFCFWECALSLIYIKMGWSFIVVALLCMGLAMWLLLETVLLFFPWWKKRTKRKSRRWSPSIFVLYMWSMGGVWYDWGEGRAILAKFLLLRAHPKSDLYKDRLIFYHNNAVLHGFGHVVTSRNRSSFLSLMKEKNQKKIKAMIAIYFCLVHVVNGRCLVRLGEGRAIFAGELLLCTLYMRKKCLLFFSIVPGVCFKNMF